MKVHYSIAVLLVTGILILTSACATHDRHNSNNSNHQGAGHNTNSSASPAASAPHDMGGMKSSPDAATAPYDLQFIDTMSAHHEEAVRMARAALERTNRAELRTFVQGIIGDQEREISQLKSWRGEWFSGRAPALNMDMPGMKESMQGMDMAKLRAASGGEFDLTFIDMMTPHHEGAVRMAQEALSRAERAEIKRLAQQIIGAQDDEVRKMREWKEAWSKK